VVGTPYSGVGERGESIALRYCRWGAWVLWHGGVRNVYGSGGFVLRLMWVVVRGVVWGRVG